MIILDKEMIRYHLKELIAEKEFEERRRITIGEIAKETGINRMTLSKIINHPGHSTVTDNLDKLCFYFDCEIEQLVTHVKEANDESAPLSD
ncbi:helix-turn-helix domain-containing protein [Vreelandella sedimenti]|jgi:putative transcriptional regulator|uniref:helix-turn-helix domain-containing protein n=1 Tax=Vreelandella sedimenti TaxID=2729618 RepID=UPI00257E23CE|nr:helix-turn-helix transcriptional regulator [Halomonas sp. UBA3173]|tara:strand:- start:39055 stop:39327 length:273 start_codon:yes stop_codon:yes gene_type:complete